MRNTLPPRCNDDGIGCILFNESAINCVSRKCPAMVASRWRRVTLIVHTMVAGNLPERSTYRASIIFMRACEEVTDTSHYISMQTTTEKKNEETFAEKQVAQFCHDRIIEKLYSLINRLFLHGFIM